MGKITVSLIALGSAFALGAMAISYGNAQNQQSSDQSNLGPALTPQQFVDPSPVPLDTDFTQSEEEDIREVVRAYLLDHPEILVEAINVYQQRQQIADEEQAKAAATDNLAALLDESNGFITGASKEDAKVAVIELFDYHCGFCKQASGLVRNLTKVDDEVLVAFREFPILRQESEIAAEAALAARKQGHYLDFHFAMMNTKGTLTSERIFDIAQKQNIDTDALEKDMNSQEVGDAIRDTLRIAREMGVSGTPAFIIASMDGNYVDVVNGFVPGKVLASVEKAKNQ